MDNTPARVPERKRVRRALEGKKKKPGFIMYLLVSVFNGLTSSAHAQQTIDLDALDWTDVATVDDASRLPLYSPAVYRAGKTREEGASKNNIEGLTALFADIERPKGSKAPPLNYERIREVFSPLRGVMHTTKRHTDEDARVRVILPFTRTVTVAEFEAIFEHFYAPWLNDEGIPFDPTGSDPAKIYFVPTRVAGIPARMDVLTGECIDPDLIFEKLNIQPKAKPEPSILDLVANRRGITEPNVPSEPSIFAGIESLSYGPPAQVPRVEAACQFMRHCRDDAETISEPEWRSWLSILARCEGGDVYAHEIGSRHPGYKRAETEKKLARVSTESGPHTCAFIKTHGDACKGCTQTVTSPITLGVPPLHELPPAERVKYEKEVTKTRIEKLEGEIARLIKERIKLENELRLARKDREYEANSEDAEDRLVDTEMRLRQVREKIRTVEKELHKTKSSSSNFWSDDRSQQDESVFEKLVKNPLTQEPISHYTNAMVVVENDPVYAELFWDDYKGYPLLNGEPIDDLTVIRTSQDLARRYRLMVDRDSIEKVLVSASMNRKVNTLSKWLRSLEWDGRPRIDALFEQISDPSIDRKFVRAAARSFFLGAAARGLRPGAKVHTMLIFVGDQGVGKSTFFRTIAGDDHFKDRKLVMTGEHKDSLQLLKGTWIYEIAELSSFRKTDVNELKSFLTQPDDPYRPPFGKKTERHLRSVVFVGTVNDSTFLTDTTGNRRFVCLRVRQNFQIPENINRDQLWAEAVARLDEGETWVLNEDERALQDRVNESYLQEDDLWWSEILRWLRNGPSGPIKEFTLAQALKAIGVQAATARGTEGRRLQLLLRHKRFVCGDRRKVGNDYGYVWKTPPEYISDVPKNEQ